MPETKLAIEVEKSQVERYAVVGLRWNEFIPELVIAYCKEESLCDLFAAPNIVAVALSSREAPEVGVTDGSSSDADSKKLLESLASISGDVDRGLQSRDFCLRLRVGLTGIRRIAFETAQRGVAAGILMFYSTNIVGAAIRAFIGA